MMTPNYPMWEWLLIIVLNDVQPYWPLFVTLTAGLVGVGLWWWSMKWLRVNDHSESDR